MERWCNVALNGKYESPMLTFTVKMPHSLLEELENYAEKRGLSKAEIARRAIRCYLRNHRDEIVTRRLRIYYAPKPDCDDCGEEE